MAADHRYIEKMQVDTEESILPSVQLMGILLLFLPLHSPNAHSLGDPVTLQITRARLPSARWGWCREKDPDPPQRPETEGCVEKPDSGPMSWQTGTAAETI